MKILCVSDQIDPLVYSASVKDRFGDVDAVFCAGDLPMDYIDFIVSSLNKPTYFIFGNHNLNDFSYYHKEHSFTPGNAAHPQAQPDIESSDLSHCHGAVYVGFKTACNKRLTVPHPVTGKPTPLLIAGVSGSLRYNSGLDQYTDGQMLLHLIALMPSLWMNKIRYGRYLDIFLTHATPRHVHDQEDPCHRGFTSFNWFIKRFRPAYMVHGHIHLYDPRALRVSQYESTTVINAYSHYLLNTDTLIKNTGADSGNTDDVPADGR